MRGKLVGQRPVRQRVRQQLTPCEGMAEHRFQRLRVIHSERLLRQYSLHQSRRARLADHGQDLARRDGDVQHLNRGIPQQFAGRVINPPYPVPRGHPRRRLAPPRGDGDRVEPRLAIGRQMTFINNEPSADHPDSIIPLFRKRRMNLEFHSINEGRRNQRGGVPPTFF